MGRAAPVFFHSMPRRYRKANVYQYKTRDDSSHGASRVSDAKFVRIEVLNWICGLWRSFESRIAQYEFTAIESRSLFAQAIVRIDEELPAFVCPVCKGVADDRKCKCGGRGWFAKNEERKYLLAAAMMVRRQTKNGSDVTDALKIDAKMQRSYKKRHEPKKTIVDQIVKELGYEPGDGSDG